MSRAATKKKAKKAMGKRAPRGAQHVPLASLSGARARAAEVLHDERVAHEPAAAPTQHRPAAPVEVLLHDARELLEVARRAGRKLVRAGLDEKLLKELPKRIALVADAQKAWEKQRSMGTTAAVRKSLNEGHQLRTDLLAAGHYVLRHDPAAQRELGAIASSDGSVQDLVADLRALAKFWEPRASRLSEGDVPTTAASRARELAAELDATVGIDHAHAATHHDERNRAVAMLDEAVSEVRAAGRYVFRRVPAQLALFRHEFKRLHDARIAHENAR